jgi:hypothetical protein
MSQQNGMRNTRLASWLVLCGILGLSSCSGNSPRTPVEIFYKWYLETQPTGLPTKEQELTIAPYLSKRLLGLIDEARSYQETFIRQSPDEKPPWIEGCLFASVFEGPTQFEISGVIKNADGTSTVKVHFRLEKYDWEDAVIVRKEANTFVIDDFLMSGAGPFNPPGRLSESLKYRGE